MKHVSLFVTCLVLPFQLLFSQADGTDSYTDKIVPLEYSIKFKDANEKKSFKLLREFLKEKEATLEILETEADKLKKDEFGEEVIIDTASNAGYRDQIAQLKRIAKKGLDENAKVNVPLVLLYPPYWVNKNRYRDSVTSITVLNVNAEIEEKENNINEATKKYENFIKVKKNLEASIRNVTSDITACTQQIDSALAPEYQQQDFRKTISISFSILIGLLLTVFFFIVYKRSDSTLSKDLLSGNGLQFITLFVLIIAVILFGILNILGSSELAAILSGISGYILGKGTQKDLSTILNASGVNQPQDDGKKQEKKTEQG